MSDRLRLAVENGHVVLPEGKLLVLNADQSSDLSIFEKEQSLVWARSAAAHAMFMSQGWTLGLQDGDYAGAVIFLPRARDAQRALARNARELTTGPLIFDGDKTNGVDAFYREMRTRADVSEAWAKAHGKVFAATNVSRWEDWPLLEAEEAEDGWWRAPGVFSADGVDKASQFLADNLPSNLSGKVVDLGAGWGFLSRTILERQGVTDVWLVEDDLLATYTATRNIADPRAHINWADALTWQPPEKVDHVVTNPPFHIGRKADPKLGQAFIVAAARMLKPQGQLWLVANRHLPYEKTLQDAFRTVELHADNPSFKIFHTTSPKRRKA